MRYFGNMKLQLVIFDLGLNDLFRAAGKTEPGGTVSVMKRCRQAIANNDIFHRSRSRIMHFDPIRDDVADFRLRAISRLYDLQSGGLEHRDVQHQGGEIRQAHVFMNQVKTAGRRQRLIV